MILLAQLNLPTIVVLAIVLIAITFAAYHSKKQGTCGCGSGHCSQKRKNKKEKNR